MKELTVLSLFDGMSCGRIALERAGFKVGKYYACEIKKSAIKVSLDNYPDIVHLGDVEELDVSTLPKIDLLIGGSPCQDFSIMKANRENLEGEKSKLFYQYLRILKETNPKYFLLENVKMNKDSESQLNEYLSVEGKHINSRLVSFQNRPRIYWSNIPNVTIPEDRGINFQDFKDTDPEYCKQFKLNQTKVRFRMWSDGRGNNSIAGGCANVTNAEKVYCLTRKQDRCPNSGLVEFEDFCRVLTTRELELAQTVPVGYTRSVSKNQAQDLLGDGWTVDVISHILKNMEF